MGSIASQITSLTIVYSTFYSDADHRKHHSSASLAFVRGFHRGPVNSPHKWPVTRKTFPFDAVTMYIEQIIDPSDAEAESFWEKSIPWLLIFRCLISLFVSRSGFNDAWEKRFVFSTVINFNYLHNLHASNLHKCMVFFIDIRCCVCLRKTLGYLWLISILAYHGSSLCNIRCHFEVSIQIGVILKVPTVMIHHESVISNITYQTIVPGGIELIIVTILSQTRISPDSMRCHIETTGTRSLAWINLNTSMEEKNCMPSKVWNEITHPFINFKDVLEEIHNFTIHYIRDVIIGLGKGNCKKRRKSFRFWNLMRLILNILRCSITPYQCRSIICTYIRKTH